MFNLYISFTPYNFHPILDYHYEIYSFLVVDGQFGDWTEWTCCDPERSERTRQRACDSPAPQNGGLLCRGNFTETRACDVCDAVAISTMEICQSEPSSTCLIDALASYDDKCAVREAFCGAASRNPGHEIESFSAPVCGPNAEDE